MVVLESAKIIMKPFAFALEKVLRIRQQQEKMAKWAQIQALADLRAARTEVARCQQQIANVNRRLQSTTGASGQLPWLLRLQQSQQLAIALQQALQQEKEVADRLAEANRVRQQAEMELEKLLTLRQIQHEAWHQEMLRAEQIQLDEHGLQNWEPDEQL